LYYGYRGEEQSTSVGYMLDHCWHVSGVNNPQLAAGFKLLNTWECLRELDFKTCFTRNHFSSSFPLLYLYSSQVIKSIHILTIPIILISLHYSVRFIYIIFV